MTRTQALAVLDAWFVERTGESCDPALPYFGQQSFDSLDAIELLEFMEKTFEVRFRADELESPSFRTLNGLAELIESRSREKT